MAGLPLFGHTFRSWMAGSTVTFPKQTNVEPQAHVFTSSKRSIEALQNIGSGSHSQPSLRRNNGIRERTDESSDLPPSNEIIQHIAESCHSRPANHIGTDNRRMTSYGSTITHHASSADVVAPQDQCDAIEAEIDQLKEDVTMLRMEADQGRTEPKTEQDLAVDRFLSTRSGNSLRYKKAAPEETAAMRLQRLHEAHQSHEAAVAPGQLSSPLPPSPLEFPVLTPSTSIPTAYPSSAEESQRKPSYADVATNGMMEAIDQAFSLGGKRRSDSKVSGSTSADQLSRSTHTEIFMNPQAQTGSTSATIVSKEIKEDETSVIIGSTHTEAITADPNTSKSDPTSEDTTTMRQSPRFAQPTKSFARRTGETLRRDAASVSPKSSADGSPGRTIKSKLSNLATKLASQPQKRRSLPGDWLSSPESNRDQITAGLSVKAGNTLARTSTSASTTVKTVSPAGNAKLKVSPTSPREKGSQQQLHQRKKANSYMAPTNATTQRTIATLGENKPKVERTVPKAPETRVEVLQSVRQTMSPPRSHTALSDDSSVHFILESDSQQSVTQQKEKVHHDDVLSPTQPHSAISRTPKSPPAATLRSMSPKSPTRGPRARGQVSSHAQKQASYAIIRATEGFSSLPPIANTTAKRRTSNSNVLAPIVARLKTEGILNKASQNNGFIQAYFQKDLADGNALRAAREFSLGTVSQPFPESSPSKPTATERPTSQIFLPPHLRPRHRGNITGSTGSEMTVGPDNSTGVVRTGRKRYLSSLSSLPTAIPVTGIAPSGGPVQSPQLASSRKPSLRATAEEFRPSSSWQGNIMATGRRWTLDYIPQEEWEVLPHQTKVGIFQARARSRDHAWFPNALQSHLLPTYGTSTAKVAAALNDASAQRGYKGSFTSFVDDNGSPNTIPIGQTLKPIVNPREKTVQWMLQNFDGKEEPACFGRAPAPDISSIFDPSTPTVSSTSDDTSPVKTPNNLRGWQIGSMLSPRPYGWTGGDGKEIKFVGYGPHAERDPSSAVNFNFQGRTASFGVDAISNNFHEDKENFSTEYAAPKSQRQWAEKLGYHKRPCGDVEITNAIEHLPFGSQLARWCHDCAARQIV